MFVKAINKNHILRPYYLLNLKLWIFHKPMSPFKYFYISIFVFSFAHTRFRLFINFSQSVFALPVCLSPSPTRQPQPTTHWKQSQFLFSFFFPWNVTAHIVELSSHFLFFFRNFPLRFLVFACQFAFEICRPRTINWLYDRNSLCL